MPRRTRFVDCRPRWGLHFGESSDRHVTFECPEGHDGCHHTIPLTPARGGEAWKPEVGAIWDRVGDDFATMTISPSIRRNARYESREKAIEAGCIPEYVNDELLCAMHVNIVGGEIQFAGDSR